MNEKQRTTSTESHTLTAAKVLLFEAGKQNPGPWIRHSEFVAVICGLLHDIGRSYGVTYLAHVYDGYRYLMELGWERAARVALSHTFNLRQMEDYIGKFDLEDEDQKMLEELLGNMEYDEYDYLIQLCDAIATAEGIVPLNERMNDVKSRYGYYPQEKWDRNIALKEYFEKKMGKPLYEVVM